MALNEPIPGQSPEPAPKPEAPKGGIKVEVRQPELMYKIATQIFEGSGVHQGVSETVINDQVFKAEQSYISAFVESKYKNPRVDGTYHFQSFLYLSDEKVGSSDRGYYSYEKVRLIQDNLARKGAKTNAYHNRGRGVARSFIVVEKDGYYIEAHFGLPNRQAEEDMIRKEVEQEKSEGRKGYATEYELPKIEQGLFNNMISIGMVDKQRAETGWEGYPRLTTQADFVRAAKAYADAYRQVIEAMYEAEGMQPPDKTLIFRPPVLNTDTVSEIASIKSEEPRSVTEQQVVKERTSFDDIAGQEVAIAEAKRLVLGINHPEVFERRGVKRPKGILFHGPSGTGKTMIAKAIADEANADFFSVTAADIGTKWYGESENLMQKVFDRANDSAKAGRKVILYFDEIDALAPNREGVHEATQKVISVMLQNMDGMKSNPNVTIIASTNRPEGIDSALRRPGRFDKFIYVGLPSVDGREKTLKVHMDKAKKAATAPGELFASDVDFAHIAQLTDTMSGADLANLVNLALEEKTMEELEGKPWTPVNTGDLETMVRRLGNIKEEKQRMGFVVPRNVNGNGQTQATTKQ